MVLVPIVVGEFVLCLHNTSYAMHKAKENFKI